MEIESKKHKLTKRRANKHVTPAEGESCDEMDDNISRSNSRSKPRKKKNHTNTVEEDIIDGFAIISFKSFEDLENVMKNSIKSGEKTISHNANHVSNPKQKKKNKKTCSPPSPHLPKLSDSSPIHSPSSDQTEDLSDPQPNAHPRTRRLSDASFLSSSGKGYECDSESGDERASDASLDIFTTVNHNRECLAPSTTSCSSPCLTPVATTTNTVLNKSDTIDTVLVAKATVPTTTSAYTTASSTAPTPSTTITTCVSLTTTSVSSVTNKVPVTTPTATTNKPPVTPPVTRSPKLGSSAVRSHSHSRPSSSTPLHKEQRKFSPTPVKTPRREEYLGREREYNREKDFPLPPSVQFNKPWTSGNAPGHLFNPNSPGLGSFSLHSTPSNPHHTFPSLPPTLNHPHATPGSHSMFAAPLPPGAPLTLTSSQHLAGASLQSHPAAAADSMSIASQEILREELNRRFLDAQGRSQLSSLTPGPYLRQDIHQHQHMHQHQHQHTHQHMYPIPPPFSVGSLVPPPASHMFEKIPKPFDSPFYPRPAPGIPGYSAVSPILHPAAPGPLSTGISGAFQPKGVGSSLHPSAMMFASLHGEREKAVPGTSSAAIPPHKKSGKWCAMHVKIAWEIHQHQQKQAEVGKTSEGKSPESFHPPGHLLSGGSLHRPGEISSNNFLGSHSGGSLLESGSLPGPSHASHLGLQSFPRPSPYSVSSIGSFGGLGGSPFSATPGREMPRIPGITSPHEWNRLHRTPPSFPGSSSWSKSEEREREKEGLLTLDRRREEERERDKRNGERHGGIEERSREREPPYSDLRHSHSRSRSRSPLVNGRVGSAKSDGSYEKPPLKIKEERREEDTVEREREKLRNDYLMGSMVANPLSANLIERARLLSGPAFPYGAERLPGHSATMWNAMDKSAVDFNHHRLQLQQEMEQAREKMLSRLQPSLNLYEQERLRKEDLLLHEERLRYLERSIFERERFERERLSIDPRGITPSIRHPDHLGPAGCFPRTISPMINHTGSKGGSPACMPGAPPPLIPSSSATSHSSSPAVGKPKLPNSTDSDKREAYSNSTDPEGHSR